jgi:YVTN family beta-propeller protein
VSAQAEIGIGSEFVGYRIDELIGRGGMGVVYRAYDLRLKRTVALKLMAPELALDQRFRERFSREAELAMSLEHPNVVPIHDAGDIDGRLYLAMRHVEGTDLRALLHAAGALDPARALAICSQVANALDAAHANGLVHRDVKPSNVLLDASEHVYLADFGLTRRLYEQGGPPGDGRSVGTPAYLAPEQIDGESVDGRADIYSLGCLLYECLTGEAPFVRGSRLAVAWAHLEEEPPRASQLRPELPEAIDAAICKAMAKEPDDRYTTCTALITAAEEALELRQPPARLPDRRTVIAVGATLLLLVAVLVVAVIIRGTAGGGVAAPAVTDDTLVRIDPATNKVDRVVKVGQRPSAVAIGGRTVWVYNDGDPSVSEIDAATGTLRHKTRVIAAPTHLDPFSGPVLAANAAGAWLVGTDARGRSYLTRVVAGPHGKREYRLEQEPLAVEVGYGAVWVIARGNRESHLLRIDPATGRVMKRTTFPASARIDGLAAGLDNVWVGASSSATLYRINPRSAGVTGRIDLGERANRPSVVLGSIWVGLSDRGGDTVIVDPRGDLSVINHLGCCAPELGYAAVWDGSVWGYDIPTGTVERWDAQTYQGTFNIHVADPPFYGGQCLTSIAAGARFVWLTAAANSNYHC